MSFSIKQRAMAAGLLVIALSTLSLAQGVTGSSRCDDAKAIQTAREEQRHQRVLQYIEYTKQRYAEAIQRARWAASRLPANRQAVAEAQIVARENRQAEYVDRQTQREESIYQENLRRVEANYSLCQSRSGGNGSAPNPPQQPVPPTPNGGTPSPSGNGKVPPENPTPPQETPAPDPAAKGLPSGGNIDLGTIGVRAESIKQGVTFFKDIFRRRK
jgi:hypothetical protein